MVPQPINSETMGSVTTMTNDKRNDLKVRVREGVRRPLD
jgi:hypothetical protein